MRLALILVVTVLLAACASAPSSLDAAAAATVRRVAVISFAGNSLIRKHVGLTVFSNEETTEDIHSWRLDSRFNSQIEDAVRLTLGAEVLWPRIDAETLAHVYDLNGPYDAPMFHTPNWEKVAAYLRELAAQSKLDGMVLLLRSETEDYVGSTNQYLKGIGLYTHGWTRALYANLDLYYVDGRTGYPLASTLVSGEDKAIAGFIPVPGRPQAELPQELADKALDTMTGLERSQLQALVLHLVSEKNLQTSVARLLGRAAGAPDAPKKPAATPAVQPVVPANPIPAAAPAAPAAQRRAGDVIQLRTPLTLYTRPKIAGAETSVVGAGAAVTLTSSAYNDSGTWWYVESGAQRGWARDTDLSP